MEPLWRKIWGHSNVDVVDPVTGLSGRDVRLVQSTWAIVKKDRLASGITVMLGFFESHPEYQSYFDEFRDVPRQDLPGNKKFQAHALSVMTALSKTVDALNNVGVLEANLTALGKRHGNRELTEQQFQHLKIVIVDVFRQTLGDQFTEETEEAWTKTFKVMYSYIFKGLSS
ncbi:globin-like [Cotesia typhae]|uniref:globin-like n=1 Tax=Cotesia typhae TaxID=2053667 RepID=UPI003D6865C5